VFPSTCKETRAEHKYHKSEGWKLKLKNHKMMRKKEKEKVAHESHNTKLGNTSWHAKPLSTKAHHHSFNLAHHQRVCESL
jgi:hypothetical protein